MSRVEKRVGHERENCVQGNSTHKAEPVYVTEVYFAAEKEKKAKEEEEEDGTEEVGVVHDVLVDTCEGIEDCKGL